MSQTMLAVRIHDYGGPDAPRVEAMPRPQPGPGQVLVRVHALGVNPVDWKIREGVRRDRMPLAMPVVLGCDLSGVIEQVGADVSGFAAGDAVFAMTGLYGAFSEFVAVSAACVARKPESLDHVRAAATPLAALTAWQGLELAGLKAGQRVLVLAGGGGVGGFAVQIAAALGAHVVATASTEKLDYVRSLGAEQVVDYRTTAFERAVSDFDVVFDLLGEETQARAWHVLKPGGVLVSAVAVPAQDELAARGVRAARVGVRADGGQLRRIAELIDAGRIRVHVEATYPLAQAAQAIERVKGGRTRGKIVLLTPAGTGPLADH
jgi:NADPH:quinone reductase-like Zn-dependent oxidoreductase